MDQETLNIVNGGYAEYEIDEDSSGGFTLSRRGWGIGYTFRSRKRAEQALVALNNAIALDYAQKEERG